MLKMNVCNVKSPICCISLQKVGDVCNSSGSRIQRQEQKSHSEFKDLLNEFKTKNNTWGERKPSEKLGAVLGAAIKTKCPVYKGWPQVSSQSEVSRRKKSLQNHDESCRSGNQ